MSQAKKLLASLTRRPRPKDFSWGDLQGVMRHFGYQEKEGSGSRKKFIHPGTKHKIILHKRHPDPTLLEYQIESVIEALESQGYLDE